MKIYIKIMKVLYKYNDINIYKKFIGWKAFLIDFPKNFNTIILFFRFYILFYPILSKKSSINRGLSTKYKVKPVNIQDLVWKKIKKSLISLKLFHYIRFQLCSYTGINDKIRPNFPTNAIVLIVGLKFKRKPPKSFKFFMEILKDSGN